MSTRINWTNPNAAFTEIRIYRTDTPFDENNIPEAPLAVLTEGTTYLDQTTEQNKYYYYTVGVVINGELILAPAKKTIHIPYTGPGPQVIQIGDNSRGYFGITNTSELFSPAELTAAVGLGGPHSAAQWVKFIRNGKILFMSLYPMTANKTITWNQLYGLGLVYGTDDNGPPIAHGLTPRNQRFVVTKGEHRFIVRLPRALDTIDWAAGNRDTTQGEIETLFSAVMLPAQAGVDALAEYTRTTYMPVDYTPLAELFGSGMVNCMHINPSGEVVGPPSGNCTRVATAFWRPVLELIL